MQLLGTVGGGSQAQDLRLECRRLGMVEGLHDDGIGMIVGCVMALVQDQNPDVADLMGASTKQGG